MILSIDASSLEETFGIQDRELSPSSLELHLFFYTSSITAILNFDQNLKIEIEYYHLKPQWNVGNWARVLPPRVLVLIFWCKDKNYHLKSWNIWLQDQELLPRVLVEIFWCNFENYCIMPWLEIIECKIKNYSVESWMKFLVARSRIIISSVNLKYLNVTLRIAALILDLKFEYWYWALPPWTSIKIKICFIGCWCMVLVSTLS